MGRRLINRQYYLGSRAPSMQMLTGENGIANLSPYLTINSTTVSPISLYWGSDATATALPAQWGSDLAIAGSGTAPSINQPAYGNGTIDQCVKFNSGTYYSGSGGQLTTGDIMIHAVVNPDKAGSYLASTFSGSGNGWILYYNSSGELAFFIKDSIGSVELKSAALTNAATIHVFGFVNRDEASTNGSGMFINSVAQTGVNASVVSGDLTGSTLGIGARSGGALQTDSGIVYLAIYEQADLFSSGATGKAEAQALATENFQSWSGITAIKATGSSAPNYFVRATPGYVDKYDSSTDTTNLIYCSAGLPRVGKKKYGTSSSFDGILIEPQATNLIPYSRDVNNAAWAKNRATIETATGVYTPDPNVETQGIVASVDNNSHYIEDSITTTAENHTISLNAKKGAVDWVSIQVSGKYCYFDLANGAIGMNNNLVDYDIVDLGDGWYRISITALYTAAAFSVLIVSGFADGTDAFAGDGSTVSTYISDIQMETGNKPTSRIVTAGASATRNADLLQYDGTTNVTAGQGTLKAEILVDTHTPTAELPIATISDGGSTDEMIRSYVDTGTKVPIYEAVDSTVSQWTITGTTDVIDSDNHTVKCLWESNNAKQYVDNVLDGTPDTSCTIPTGLDRIDVAKGVGSGEQLNGWIRDVKIFGFASGDV